MAKISKKISIILLCAALPLSFAACSDSSINAEDTGVTNNMAADNSTGTTDNKNIGNGKNIYFAGPMFNQSEKDYNLKITAVLEEYGYHVFLPQRDGIEAALLEGKTEDELIKMIFELDAGKVKESDIIFMNMDGRVPDEGACVELGIAYSEGKHCYGFKTDTRAVESELDINPMISGCMIKIFKNYDGDKMIEELRQYLSENEL